MDAVLWILLIAAVAYAWVRVVSFALRADRKKSVKDQFDDITKRFFTDHDDPTQRPNSP